MTDFSSNDQCRLYGDLTWIWPVISPVEDYIEETRQIVRLIREHSMTEVKSLLDLGCGGGHYDYTLKEHFEVTGIDVSESMLSLARRLNPEAAYHYGDMRTLRLGKKFDAVMIADSINYMLTERDLRAAFETAYTHLEPGGVFWTFAEVTTERFKQNRSTCSTHEGKDVEIAYFENYYDPDTTDTNYEISLIYLIRRRGCHLELEMDRHLCGVFKLETWLGLLQDIGFEVEQSRFGPEACPMFVCLKPL
ncbi:MAG: class I SAM-dependent methyltransferase [Gemmatimonadota bacterium]|nr:class I SAM-dependent methyltransferase [Gemmatimonadota bacterium]